MLRVPDLQTGFSQALGKFLRWASVGAGVTQKHFPGRTTHRQSLIESRTGTQPASQECVKRLRAFRLDAFASRQTAGILPGDLVARMQHMVGFRNVAVHAYTRLNLDILHTIITKHLDDFRPFSSAIVKACA
ncbi:MAG: DUF86 domain-containing protein [Nitrospira defluvii]|nr:DUF86 domain-containing protein [Nitrospira defluvii]